MEEEDVIEVYQKQMGGHSTVQIFFFFFLFSQSFFVFKNSSFVMWYSKWN
jgi:hypothetical protein